jgi:hypothetical protein
MPPPKPLVTPSTRSNHPSPSARDVQLNQAPARTAGMRRAPLPVGFLEEGAHVAGEPAVMLQEEAVGGSVAR